MRSLWLSLFLLVFINAGAQNYERLSEYEQNLYGESVFVNGDYETMKAVRAFWVKESKRLKNRNCEFVLCGNSEAVLKVTIPSRLLFTQDDTALSHHADALLRPLLSFIVGEDALASCIIACHSDNNGSDRYLSKLTQDRAASLDAWFQKQGVLPPFVAHYGLATKVPRTQNENIRNRELNRRVTIYLVPSKKMLKLAKKGKL